MGLGLLDSESFEFMIVSEGESCAWGNRLNTLSPPRSIAIGKLRDCCNAFLRTLPPALSRSSRRGAKILPADSNVSTPRLEVTNRTMFIQNQRRRFLIVALRRDCPDDIPRFWEVVSDLGSLDVFSVAPKDSSRSAVFQFLSPAQLPRLQTKPTGCQIAPTCPKLNRERGYSRSWVQLFRCEAKFPPMPIRHRSKIQ